MNKGNNVSVICIMYIEILINVYTNIYVRCDVCAKIIIGYYWIARAVSSGGFNYFLTLERAIFRLLF